ncbi:hypothetical protein DL240_00180 [Lujinxingia litoralis]|uniref:Uncharacterized protein n=2 Tax=Lujinxingia litoralis TaxID=2211119 RepID=A0A328CC01_9DELT|nr:hypothetical protein DL240_00180 [Lujinxingia litoralis]
MTLNSPLRHVVAAGALAGFLMLNPMALGCGEDGSESGYQFGAEEMSAVVVGSWEGRVRYEGREPVSFELAMEPASATGASSGSLRQALCGERTLVAAAQACLATSELDVVAVLRDGEHEAVEMEGTLVAYGAELSMGELTLYGAGRLWRVQMEEGALAPAGEVRDQQSGEALGSFDLARRDDVAR